MGKKAIICPVLGIMAVPHNSICIHFLDSDVSWSIFFSCCLAADVHCCVILAASAFISEMSSRLIRNTKRRPAICRDKHGISRLASLEYHTTVLFVQLGQCPSHTSTTELLFSFHLFPDRTGLPSM